MFFESYPGATSLLCFRALASTAFAFLADFGLGKKRNLDDSLSLSESFCQWIGLRENLQETHGFLPSNIGLSCKFSHHPILWFIALEHPIGMT
jgi:hypothetical protein